MESRAPHFGGKLLNGIAHQQLQIAPPFSERGQRQGSTHYNRRNAGRAIDLNQWPDGAAPTPPAVPDKKRRRQPAAGIPGLASYAAVSGTALRAAIKDGRGRVPANGASSAFSMLL